MSTPQILAIPLKLDAFVLNAAVCGGTDPKIDGNKDKAKIAPLTQPNYTFLRFERTFVQNDVLDFADLHKTGPASYNPRFTDLGTGEPRRNRQGVYVHWIVPRPYRTGSTISQDSKVEADSRSALGLNPKSKTSPQEVPVEEGDLQLDDPPLDVADGDTSAPGFNSAPPRWLVIRKVEECDPVGALPEVDAWVVESDRRQVRDDISPTADLQVDISPYVYGTDAKVDKEALESQAEVFIGYKAPARDWKETVGDPHIPVKDQPLRVEHLNLVNSSNQLFPDYQPHNSNVFSIVRKDPTKERGHGAAGGTQEELLAIVIYR